MPELPEVETTRRGLAPAMVGKAISRVILNRNDLRFPIQADFRDRVEGRIVERIDRRAKYLLLGLSGRDVLVAHLGMSGSFRVESGNSASSAVKLYRQIPRLEAHDHVIFEMSDGTRIVYNDPRRFGFMFVVAGSELDCHPRMRGIGVEPLDPRIDPDTLARLFDGASANLKAALLDQKRIAGLGNIYVCEALHRQRPRVKCRLSPFSIGGRYWRFIDDRYWRLVRASDNLEANSANDRASGRREGHDAGQ